MLNIKFEANQIYDYEDILQHLSLNRRQRYNEVLEDAELVEYFKNTNDDDLLGQIEIWKRKTDEYCVDRDYRFFLYAMMSFLDGDNLLFGLSFLYGQSIKVRHDVMLQNTLKAMSGKAYEFYSNRPIFTKEEKIEELLMYDICPFSDTTKEKEKESPFSICRNYPTCKDCLMHEFTDELYYPLEKTPKLPKR